MKTKAEKTNSEKQAESQLESIIEMTTLLEQAREQDCDKLIEEAEQAIQQDALSIECRSGWYAPGAERTELKPVEYTILLCTGGPACRIIGDLSEYGEPETARIEHQDWGTYWTDLPLDTEQEEKVLTYARCFYFNA